MQNNTKIFICHCNYKTEGPHTRSLSDCHRQKVSYQALSPNGTLSMEEVQEPWLQPCPSSLLQHCTPAAPPVLTRESRAGSCGSSGGTQQDKNQSSCYGNLTSFNGEGTTPPLCSSCEVLIRNCTRNFHAAKKQKRRRLTKDTRRTKQLPASSSPGTCSANPLRSLPPTNTTSPFVKEVTATRTATSPSLPTARSSQFLLTAYSEYSTTSLPRSHCSALSSHCFPRMLCSLGISMTPNNKLLFHSEILLLLQQADLLLKVIVRVPTSSLGKKLPAENT